MYRSDTVGIAPPTRPEHVPLVVGAASRMATDQVTELVCRRGPPRTELPCR